MVEVSIPNAETGGNLNLPPDVNNNVDKVIKVFRKTGADFPDDIKQKVMIEAQKINLEISDKDMKPKEIMSSLDGRIGKLETAYAINKISTEAADLSKKAMDPQSANVPEKRLFTGEQLKILIMGLAILATILILAKMNPAWAAKAVIALIAVLGGLLSVEMAKKTEVITQLMV